MKKIKSFIITIIFLLGIFYSINFSFADDVWCGAIKCGYVASYSLTSECWARTNQPNPGSPISCYLSGNRITIQGDVNEYGYISNSEVISDFEDQNAKGKFFGGPGSLSVSRENSIMQVYFNGQATTIFDYCSSTGGDPLVCICNKPQNTFNIESLKAGDKIGFYVKSERDTMCNYTTNIRGTVDINLNRVTFCYKSSYFDYFCDSPSPGCSGKPNYIPTSDGVCSPETKPKAKLNAYWKENNSQSIEKTITQGQSIQIPFIVENIGDIGSVIDNIQCILSDPSLGSISNCPSSLNK
jgi:hypothetical protein